MHALPGGKVQGTLPAVLTFRSALKARGFVAKREAGTGRSGFLGLRLRRQDYTDNPRWGG